MAGGGARWLRAMVLLGALAACGGSEEAGRGQGVVLQVFGDGRIELDHGDIPGVMPAMIMEFEIAPALLEGIDPGDHVDFVLSEAGGRYRVTAISERP